MGDTHEEIDVLLVQWSRDEAWASKGVKQKASKGLRMQVVRLKDASIV